MHPPEQFQSNRIRAGEESVFHPHRIVWTPEKVDRFWKWLSTASNDEQYFAKQHGAEVVAIAAQSGALKSPVLDFGCGPGFLLDHLLQWQLDAFGADMSESSVLRVKDRLGKNPRFMGAETIRGMPSSLPTGRFASAFLLETIEHLDDEALTGTLTELRRLLAPGGHLIVTTPNDERLADREVLCPECGCTFHRVQHVRSFSATTLQGTLARHAFHPVSVRECTLGARRPFRNLRDLIRRFRGRKELNLIGIFRRGREP